MADQEYIISIPVDVTDRTEPGASTAQKKIDKMAQDIHRFRKETEGIGGSLGRMGSIANRVFTGMGKAVNIALVPLRMLRKALFSLPGLILGGAGFMGLIKAPINLADNLATAESGFQTMLGTADKAKKMLKDIQKFAIETPFGQMEVVENARRMLTMGWAPENVLRDLRRIGDISAALGRGGEGIARITLALSQMRMKGKMTGEEMRQLTEAGVKAWDYMAKGMGKSTAELQKMASKGLIPAEKAIDLILKGMDEFSGMMDKMATRTVGGLISQIADTFNVSLVLRWGSGIQKGAIKALDSLNQYLNNNAETLQRWGNILEDLGESFSVTLAGGVERFMRRLDSAFKSDAWRKADTFGKKLRVVWDKIIVEPFGEWWASGGEQKIGRIAENMGKMLGGTMAGFVKAALGITADVKSLDPFVSAGVTAGKKFFKGFIGAIEPSKLAAKIAEGVPKMVGGTILDATQGKVDVGKLGGMAALGWIFRKPLGALFGLGKKGTAALPTPAAAGAGMTTTVGGALTAPAKQLVDQFGRPLVSQTVKEVAKSGGILKNIPFLKGLSNLSPTTGGLLARTGGVLKNSWLALALAGIEMGNAPGREKLRVAGKNLFGIAGSTYGGLLGMKGGPWGAKAGAVAGYSTMAELYDRMLTWADEKWGAGRVARQREALIKQAQRGPILPELERRYRPITPAVTGGKIVIEVKDSSTITVNAKATAEDVQKALKDKKGQIADNVANQIATKLGQHFGNMPVLNPVK